MNRNYKDRKWIGSQSNEIFFEIVIRIQYSRMPFNSNTNGTEQINENDSILEKVSYRRLICSGRPDITYCVSYFTLF